MTRASPTSLADVRAITIDLDDTLWPIRPTLVAAEQVLHDWLRVHAPATAAGMGPQDMLALRARVALELPGLSHDLTELRRETLRRALAAHGDDPALAVPAFDVFFEARHDVRLYDDVRPALVRLSARFPLLALSNGNAEVARVGLGDCFSGSVSARLHGRAKPDPSIFLAACDAVSCTPAQVLHLGDDLELDIAAARAAGLHAGWVHRTDSPHDAQALDDPRHAGAHRFATLAEVAERLGC